MNHPVIPPPPPTVVRRGAQREARILFWIGFLILGAIVGAAFYAYLPFIRESFDYWLALVLP